MTGSGASPSTAGIRLLDGGDSGNFPTTPGAFDRTATGYDGFVAKLDATGSNLVYSTILGGSTPGIADWGSGIAIDPAGNAYLVGTTEDATFPTTPGAFDTTPNGPSSASDAFVTKLNPTRVCPRLLHVSWWHRSP